MAAGKPADKPARGKRGPLPAELPRVDIVHDVPEGERFCPCGILMVEIDQDVSEQLAIDRHACAITAALPPQPLPKSNASADFLPML